MERKYCKNISNNNQIWQRDLNYQVPNSLPNGHQKSNLQWGLSKSTC